MNRLCTCYHGFHACWCSSVLQMFRIDKDCGCSLTVYKVLKHLTQTIIIVKTTLFTINSSISVKSLKEFSLKQPHQKWMCWKSFLEWLPLVVLITCPQGSWTRDVSSSTASPLSWISTTKCWSHKDLLGLQAHTEQCCDGVLGLDGQTGGLCEEEAVEDQDECGAKTTSPPGQQGTATGTGNTVFNLERVTLLLFLRSVDSVTHSHRHTTRKVASDGAPAAEGSEWNRFL